MSKKSKAVNIQQPLLLDLPCEILTNILSRLPVRSVINCKYVCKQFLQILSTHEFATYHLSVSTPPGLVIYQMQNERLFKLLEYEDTLKLQTHDLGDLKVMEFKPDATMDDPRFSLSIRGSVNGLLCLERIAYSGSFYICNPITREYIHIPMPEHTVGIPKFARSGFGKSGLSGQYKVVVNYNEKALNGLNHRANTVNECFVYTLGTTGSWRSIAPDASTGIVNHYTGQFLSGNLHWLVGDKDSREFISCFDLETELFKPFSSPPILSDFACGRSLVVLEGSLCLFDMTSDDYYDILWVMTEYGVEKSWTRKLAIRHELLDNSDLLHLDTIFPIAAFADGGLLYSWDNEFLFYYCDKTKTSRFIDASQEDGNENFENIIHTFSFLSLKSFGVENVISF